MFDTTFAVDLAEVEAVGLLGFDATTTTGSAVKSESESGCHDTFSGW